MEKLKFSNFQKQYGTFWDFQIFQTQLWIFQHFKILKTVMKIKDPSYTENQHFHNLFGNSEIKNYSFFIQNAMGSTSGRSYLRSPRDIFPIWGVPNSKTFLFHAKSDGFDFW